MAGGAVIKIERNDSDSLFRDKCNTNFNQLARGAILDGSMLQVIADSDSVASIVIAMNDKVSYYDFNEAILVIANELDVKLEQSNLIAGAGIKLTVSGKNIIIDAVCPIPIGGIHLTTKPDNPSTVWIGTTWRTVTQTGIPASAWERLT